MWTLGTSIFLKSGLFKIEAPEITRHLKAFHSLFTTSFLLLYYLFHTNGQFGNF